MRFPRTLAVVGISVMTAALVAALVFVGRAQAAPQARQTPLFGFHHSCDTAPAGFAHCDAIMRVAQNAAAASVKPLTSGCSNPSNGYTPCDLQSAYKRNCSELG